MTGLRLRFAFLLLALVAGTVAVGSGLDWKIAAATGTVVALAIAWRVAGGIERRAQELGRSLRTVAAGETVPRLVWQEPGEVARIAQSVNEIGARMSERREAVASEHERLRAVLNGMAEGVLVLDAGGRTLLANRRLRELFDAWGDVEGRTSLEVIRRTDVEEAISRASQQEPVLAEVVLPDERCVEMHAVGFPDDGPLLGTVAVFHDVTEIRRLEGMRRDFVANVSHELRTPLTAIRGFAETLLGSEAEPVQRDQQLGIILRHAERLSALIEDLLELSRIEARRTPVEALPLDAAALCRSVLRDLKPRFEEREIQCVLDAGTARPALADRRSLEQVLLNLLDNALKYTNGGGEVRVSVREEADRLRIDVADTGMGIPAADLGRVFERFYRVDKARARDVGGTGLGLAIVKHAVQAMDGEVFVESTEGEGTTLSVLLRLVESG